MLKIIVIVLLGAFVLAGAYLWYAAKKSQQMAAPALAETGPLAACPTTPNCVCSECAGEHFIAPLSYPENLPSVQLLADVELALVALGGKNIVRGSDRIRAEFRTSLYGFVDDVSLRIDAANQQLHWRSASRVGRSDFGANAKRLAALGEQLKHRWGN